MYGSGTDRVPRLDCRSVADRALALRPSLVLPLLHAAVSRGIVAAQLEKRDVAVVAEANHAVKEAIAHRTGLSCRRRHWLVRWSAAAANHALVSGDRSVRLRPPFFLVATRLSGKRNL